MFLNWFASYGQRQPRLLCDLLKVQAERSGRTAVCGMSCRAVEKKVPLGDCKSNNLQSRSPKSSPIIRKIASINFASLTTSLAARNWTLKLRLLPSRFKSKRHLKRADRTLTKTLKQPKLLSNFAVFSTNAARRYEPKQR